MRGKDQTPLSVGRTAVGSTLKRYSASAVPVFLEVDNVNVNHDVGYESRRWRYGVGTPNAALHMCGNAYEGTKPGRRSKQQPGHIDQVGGHLGERLRLLHRQLAQGGVGGIFVEAAAFHQDALGLVDELALG